MEIAENRCPQEHLHLDTSCKFGGPLEHVGFGQSLGLRIHRELVESRLQFITAKDTGVSQRREETQGTMTRTFPSMEPPDGLSP